MEDSSSQEFRVEPQSTAPVRLLELQPRGSEPVVYWGRLVARCFTHAQLELPGTVLRGLVCYILRV